MKQVSGNLITRDYCGFRGVDFSNRKDEIDLSRSPDALNMWKNYKSSGGKCIETRPDVELLGEFSKTIFGLFFYDYGNKKHMIVHSGNNLYDDVNIIYSNMAEHKSNFFIYSGKLYIQDGTHYLVYDGTTCTDVVGFIPTTYISMSPSGGGTQFQDINYLSPYQKNSFCSDGESTEYKLNAVNLDQEQIRVWVNDTELTSGFSCNYSTGVVTFTTAPSEPLTVGQDNVIIQFKKTEQGYADTILKCTLAQVFDNRVFFSGNPDHPNMLYCSELDEPSYFGDNKYYPEGQDDSPVNTLIVGNNALWVLKKPSQSNTTIFYHNPVLDSDNKKVYPGVHSSISTGCQTTGVNFNDTICFYSDRGLEGITSDINTEQVISHKSSFVDNRLLNEDKYKDMILEEWEGYLLTIIGNKVYLADSRQMTTVVDHIEYEWYYFEFDQDIVATRVKDNILYLATEEQVKENGVLVTKHRLYTLTNNEDREVEAYWTTIQDEFKYPQYQKTTNKKGCVIDMEGTDVNVYAKTDNNKFDLIKKLKNKKGYVVSRVKKKKWKSIQLKFESTHPFSVFEATLEAYVGSYVKR